MALNKDEQEFFAFLGDFGSLIGTVAEDGKIDLSDFTGNLPTIWGLIQSGTAAFQGKENLKLSDLLKSENQDEVYQIFGQHFNLDANHAQLEAIIEKSLKTLVTLVALVDEIRSIQTPPAVV